MKFHRRPIFPAVILLVLSAPLADIRSSRPSSVVCINNAAVAGPIGVGGRLSARDIAASFEVNLAAPAAIANVFCRVFADGVEDRRIINVSSGAAQTVLPPHRPGGRVSPQVPAHTSGAPSRHSCNRTAAAPRLPGRPPG